MWLLILVRSVCCCCCYCSYQDNLCVFHLSSLLLQSAGDERHARRSGYRTLFPPPAADLVPFEFSSRRKNGLGGTPVSWWPPNAAAVLPAQFPTCPCLSCIVSNCCPQRDSNNLTARHVKESIMKFDYCSPNNTYVWKWKRNRIRHPIPSLIPPGGDSVNRIIVLPGKPRRSYHILGIYPSNQSTEHAQALSVRALRMDLITFSSQTFFAPSLNCIV